LESEPIGENSALIKARVEAARGRQKTRFTGLRFISNGEMSSVAVREFCPLDEASKSLMQAAVAQFDLSARAYFRILKLGRTIADLAGSEEIKAEHLAEALQYRPKVE